MARMIPKIIPKMIPKKIPRVDELMSIINTGA